MGERTSAAAGILTGEAVEVVTVQLCPTRTPVWAAAAASHGAFSDVYERVTGRENHWGEKERERERQRQRQRETETETETERERETLCACVCV